MILSTPSRFPLLLATLFAIFTLAFSIVAHPISNHFFVYAEESEVVQQQSETFIGDESNSSSADVAEVEENQETNSTSQSTSEIPSYNEPDSFNGEENKEEGSFEGKSDDHESLSEISSFGGGSYLTVDIVANGSQGPLTLSNGQQFTLAWISANAYSCNLKVQNGQDLGGVQLNGNAGPIGSSHPFYPTVGASKTFVITCVDEHNYSKSDSVIVQVTATADLPPAPVLNATTGSQCGGSVSLSWNSISSATSYKIFRNNTQIATTSLSVFVDTNLTPGTSFNYFVKALNGAGDSSSSNIASATASSICSSGDLTVDIVANGSQGPLTLSNGQQFTLAWISANAYSCNLKVQNGQDLGAVGLNGSAGPIGVTHPLYPSLGGNVTFVITCIDGQLSVSDSVTIIRPQGENPTVSLVAQPQLIQKGQNSTLSWSASNVSNCSAPWTTATSTSGTQVVTPATTTVYAITCTGSLGSISATTTVQVFEAPQCIIPVIESALNVTGKVGVAFSYSISATTTGTTTIISYSVATTSLPAGLTFSGNTISGVPSQSGTFPVSLSAANQCGVDTETLVMTITPQDSGGGDPKPSIALSANPATISQGQNSTLSWSASNVSNCSAPWTTATSTSGTQVVTPATTTHYSITCSGNYGNVSATTTVSVSASNPVPSVALSANPTTISQGQNSTLSWTSNNVTSCSALWTVSTSTSGTQAIGPSNTTQYDITCSGQYGVATSSVTVIVNPVSSGGGSSSSGGGSRSGDRNRGSVPFVPSVLGATSCDYLRDYLKIDWVNDRVEVLKLQIFLKELEGFKDLKITGVFDQATFDAVGIFQERYQEDILTPWGHDASTSFVYILTKKKVNEIVCNRAFPLNSSQEQEIFEFRSFLMNLTEQGIPVTDISGGTDFNGPSSLGDGPQISAISSEGSILSQNGEEFVRGSNENENATENGSFAEDTKNNEQIENIAAAILAGPQGWDESLNAVLAFVAILLGLYLISQSIVERQNRKNVLPFQSLRIRKVFLFILGLVLVTLISFFLSFYPIILPLITLVVFLSVYLLWFMFRKKETQALIELPPQQ